MNKAFKVLWNQVRGSYVVASEAQVTHGKPGKAVKTIVAAAVAGLMAVSGSALAVMIDSDYFYGEDASAKSMKFIDGDGEKVVIETKASAGLLLEDLKAAMAQEDLSVKLSEILKAISQQNYDEKTAIPALVAGGSNFMDYSTQEAINFAGPLLGVDVSGKFDDVTIPGKEVSAPSYNLTGDTLVEIGLKGNEPVTLLVAGGDRVINTGMKGSGLGLGSAGSGTSKTFDVVRKGNSNVVSQSGNIFGLVGGSSAINVGAIDVRFGGLASILGSAQTLATDTNVTLDGSTDIHLAGSTGSMGVLVGGSAIALGGNATSTVTQGAKLKIDTAVDSSYLEGYHVGILGAGLSAATSKGQSVTTVENGIDITVDKGIVLGTFGAGISAATDLSSVLPQDLGQGKPWVRGINLDGGTSTIKVTGGVDLSFNANSSAVAVMGGGAAVASTNFVQDNNSGWPQDREGANTSKSTVEVHGDININIGDNTTKVLADPEKTIFHQDVVALFNDFKDGFELGDLTVNKIQQYTKTLSKEGVHAAILGSGMAVANASNHVDNVTAQSSVENVWVNLKGGYNVGTLAGGASIAKVTVVKDEDQAAALKDLEDGQTTASTQTKQTVVHITGGENLLVAGGGGTYATAGNGEKSTVLAESNVDHAYLIVDGGSVDGLYGGGIAIDDTNASATNSRVTTTNITIEVNGGSVNEANVSPIVANIKGQIGETGAPTNGAYVNDTVKLIDQANVAILGAGMASGAGAVANTTQSTLNLSGGTITGSVFGGGAATFGGKSTVENSEINLSGAKVVGDIYAGGLAGSERNDGQTINGQYYQTTSFYNKPTSIVGNSEITISGGQLEGDIYTGGYIYKDSEGIEQSNPVVEVNKATVIFAKDGVLTKKDALVDGSGAKESHLQFKSDSFDLTGKTFSAFNTISSQTTVSGMSYEFGSRDTTVVSGQGYIDFDRILFKSRDTLVIGDDQTAGIASIDNLMNLEWDAPETARAIPPMFTIDVNKGLMSLNADSETALASLPLASAEAALYVTGEVDLNEMAVTVGDVEAPAAGLYLGADGLLIADAAAKSEVKGTADTAKGKIHFTGVAEDGAQVTVAAADETATSVDNVLFKVVKNDNVYTFAQRQGKELRSVGLDDFDDTDFLADLHNHDNDGARFVEEFLDERNTGVTNANRSQQLNAAVNLATAAGVQTAAIDSATIGMDAANKRASMIHEFEEGAVLFAEASGRRTEMGGSADFGEIKAELGGVVVGGEYTTGDWTFGALANVGTGSVKGLGHNDGVENDVDYYGAQAYAAKRFGQFNVVGQLGYLATSNEISHSTVALNKADVDADVIMAGVRGEVRFDLTENTRLVPYVGFNYLRVGTDGYTTSQGVKVDSVDQNLFTVPVGVKYAGDMQTASGWAWTPSVDIGYVAAFGDRDVDAKTHVGAVGSTTMDVWAESVVRSSIGLKAQKDNFGIGVEAGGVVGSQDTTGLFGQIRVDYRF